MLENMIYIHLCNICNKKTSKMLILMYINLDPWKNNNGKTSTYIMKIYNMIYIYIMYTYIIYNIYNIYIYVCTYIYNMCKDSMSVMFLYPSFVST